MKPQATPYDILPLPYFPLEAKLSWLIYILLIFLFLVGIVVLFFRRRSKTKLLRSSNSSNRQFEHCLKLSQGSELNKENLDFLLKMAKIFLTPDTEQPLLALDSTQLMKLKSTTTDDKLKKCLNTILDIETERFKRTPNQELLNNNIRALYKLVSESRELKR